MKALNVRQLSILRNIAYSYFLILSIVCIYSPAHYVNWQFLIISSLVALQMKYDVRVIDGLICPVVVLISLYMMLAVTSDIQDHFNGTKVLPSPNLFIIFGYGIFGLSVLCASTILYVLYKRENLAEKDQAGEATVA